jgi:hypothetical protein
MPKNGGFLIGLVLFPRAGGEQDENGHDLKTSQQHIERKQYLRKKRIAGKIARRTDLLQTGANVVDAGQGRGEIGFQAISVQ